MLRSVGIILSFHHLGLRNQIQVAGLAGKYPYPLGYLSSPSEIVISKIGIVGLDKVEGTLCIRVFIGKN